MTNNSDLKALSDAATEVEWYKEAWLIYSKGPAKGYTFGEPNWQNKYTIAVTSGNEFSGATPEGLAELRDRIFDSLSVDPEREYERGITHGFNDAMQMVKRGEIDPQTYDPTAKGGA